MNNMPSYKITKVQAKECATRIFIEIDINAILKEMSIRMNKPLNYFQPKPKNQKTMVQILQDRKKRHRMLRLQGQKLLNKGD